MQSLGTSWYIVTCPMLANDAKHVLQKCCCQLKSLQSTIMVFQLLLICLKSQLEIIVHTCRWSTVSIIILFNGLCQRKRPIESILELLVRELFTYTLLACQDVNVVNCVAMYSDTVLLFRATIHSLNEQAYIHNLNHGISTVECDNMLS